MTLNVVASSKALFDTRAGLPTVIVAVRCEVLVLAAAVKVADPLVPVAVAVPGVIQVTLTSASDSQVKEDGDLPQDSVNTCPAADKNPLGPVI